MAKETINRDSYSTLYVARLEHQSHRKETINVHSLTNISRKVSHCRATFINNGTGQGYYVVDPADPVDVRNLMIYLAKIDSTIRSLRNKREVGYDILSEVVSSE